MGETLLTVWQETVRRDPDAPAVIDGATGRCWTRRALAQAAETWRAALPAGTGLAGRRVVMAEPNGARWFEVFLGLLQAGAVPVPTDPTEPAPARLATAAALGAAAGWHDGRFELLDTGRRPRRHGACLVKLTSGSTGAPRALEFTHAQMLADGRQVCAGMGLLPADLNLAAIPLGHSYGLGNIVIPLLIHGVSLLCPAGPLPQALAADAARWRPTVFPAVPTLLRALVRSDLPAGALDSLRLVISAGAPLPPEVALAFRAQFGRGVHNFYGSSETGGITFDRTGTAALTGRSVGTPLPGVRLEFRGGRRFTVTSAAVLGRGRFSPADLAELDAAGELVLLGRTGRTVKIGGRRLDLGEVERALLALPGVRAACAGPHPDRPDAMVAAVAADWPAADLRAQLAARVAAWKIPKKILVLPELPQTVRGKLDRRRIEELLRA